jgi:hypothetical protein
MALAGRWSVPASRAPGTSNQALRCDLDLARQCRPMDRPDKPLGGDEALLHGFQAVRRSHREFVTRSRSDPLIGLLSAVAHPLIEVVQRRSDAATMGALLQETIMSEHQDTTTAHGNSITHNSFAPPVTIPTGHIGEFVIPGTGRRVWWTGRVAIGLMHRPERYFEPVAQSSLWIQKLMLGKSHRTAVPQR